MPCQMGVGVRPCRGGRPGDQREGESLPELTMTLSLDFTGLVRSSLEENPEHLFYIPFLAQHALTVPRLGACVKIDRRPVKYICLYLSYFQITELCLSTAAICNMLNYKP